MDAFEQIVKIVLEGQGWWVRQGYKVELTKEERLPLVVTQARAGSIFAQDFAREPEAVSWLPCFKLDFAFRRRIWRMQTRKQSPRTDIDDVYSRRMLFA